jgi:hypothetical protein
MLTKQGYVMRIFRKIFVPLVEFYFAFKPFPPFRGSVYLHRLTSLFSCKRKSNLQMSGSKIVPWIDEWMLDWMAI